MFGPGAIVAVDWESVIQGVVKQKKGGIGTHGNDLNEESFTVPLV